MDLELRQTRMTTRLNKGGRHGIIRIVGLRLALSLVAVTVVFLATSRAKDSDIAVSKQSLEAKIRYCQDCHGLSAQGYRGFYPIPRLATQQPEYLKNQLRAFIARSRPNPIMSNVAHVLKPAMIEAIAAYLQHLNPSPIGGAPKRLVAPGRTIFENGVPQANIAACAACHGPDATGHGEIPRLAGQLYPYVVKTLANWSKERGQDPANPDTSLIMKPVAHSLNKSQIEAVAAYVSSLR